MGVWIDTDMGFDDLAAILIVAQAGVPIDGVSLVFGNSPIDQVKRNAAGAVATFGWDFPIHAGRAAPVLGQMETAQSILGPTGMRSAGKTLPDRPDAARDIPGDAFAALCRWLEDAPDGAERRILALGPLTNIAALALARPDLAAKITDLTWMGGAIGRGNHTPFAEFNAFADPEAVAIVLAHHMPLRMIDLDLCRKVPATPNDIAPLRKAAGQNADLLADLMAGYVNIALERGRDHIGLYDPTAAVAFVAGGAGQVEPIVSFADAHIEMSLAQNETRGRTVTTIGPDVESNAQYGAEIDVARARELIFGALGAEAEK